MLTEGQVPYTGPYGLATTKFKHNGPTAEALKRAMGHLGLMPWRDYDQEYNSILNSAMVHFKQNQNLIPKSSGDGSYGQGAWKALRNRYYLKDGVYLPVFDSYCQHEIQAEAKVTSTSDHEALVQHYLTEFWTIAIDHHYNWTYNEHIRPIRVDTDPADGAISDCSGTVIMAHFYAHKRTGFAVPDPSKNGYDGYGNTDIYEADWPHVSAPFRIGDIAHFSGPRHVIECIAAGDRHTAHWGSNGHQGAPEFVAHLDEYRVNDFLFVVRPTLLAA